MGIARHDYLPQVGASSSLSEWCKALRRGLDERAALLGLQETYLEVCEVIMVVELDHDLHRSDGHNLPAELYKAHAWVNEIASD
jgi:hypothetical protein